MEVACAIAERKEKHGDSTYFVPKGSIIGCKLTQTIVAKWVEICGDILQPKRRATTAITHAALGAEAIIREWQPAWLDASRACEWGHISAAEAWAIVNRTGWAIQLGADPRGDVPLCAVWPWSVTERKLFLILSVDAEDYGVKVQPTEDYLLEDRVTHGPRYYIDYVNDLGISAATLAEIDDKEFTFHPRYNHPVAATAMKRSDGTGTYTGANHG